MNCVSDGPSVVERDTRTASLLAILRRIFRIRKHAESSRQRGALGDRVAARRGPLSLSTRYTNFLTKQRRQKEQTLDTGYWVKIRVEVPRSVRNLARKIIGKNRSSVYVCYGSNDSSK